MFDTFPRELCTPKRKVILTMDEMVHNINRLNGKVNLFTSIYSFDDCNISGEYFLPRYDTARIDKMFFDFANDNCYVNALKLHEWCNKNNIKHNINFSGRKFHAYIYIMNSEFCKDKKRALFNAQTYICKELGFSYGIENHAINSNPDIDSKLMGNLAGLTRLPNTYNLQGKRFCICLNKESLLSGFENIKKLAEKQQHFRNIIFNKEYLDISKFDNIDKEINKIEIPLIDNDIDFGDENFYPCIKKMLIDRSGFEGWFYSAIWLREKGFTKNESDNIFKKYLIKYKRNDGSVNDYLHSKNSDKTVQSVYNDKDKYLFPKCETLFLKGFCPGKCKHYNDMYAMRKNV